MLKSPTSTPTIYRSLVVKITRELTDVETFVRNRTAEDFVIFFDG